MVWLAIMLGSGLAQEEKASTSFSENLAKTCVEPE